MTNVLTRRVVFVDDHLVLAELLASAMGRGGLDATALPPDRDLVIDHVSRHPVDVAVLDVDLGEGKPGGLELIRPLRDLGARVLMLTGADEPLVYARCYREGASCVLSKAQSFADLVEALDVAARDGAVHQTPDVHRLIEELERHEAERSRRLAPFRTLTRREEDVLQSLSDGLNATEIAQRGFVSLATVRTQVRSILSKLGAHSQLAAVAAAREAGWEPES